MANLSSLELVFPLVVGMAVGYLLRGRKKIDFEKVTFASILALIFSLGFNIGSNNDLLNSLPKVGLNAAIIALLSVMLSVVFVRFARKSVGLS